MVSSNPIDQALADASTTRQVVTRRDAVADTGRIVATYWPNRQPRIVADARTFEIAGDAVLDSLRAAGIGVAEPIVFPATPILHPDTRHVARIRAVLDASSLPIAVGSGTINDLVKRAAFEAGVPYVVVATAASMDGYTASGSALVHDGVKQTFPCPAPEVVIADLAILAAAPAEMTAAGYGDLAGKVTAGADWILADALGIEPIAPAIWKMVQEPLPGMIAEPERFFHGDETSIAQLFVGLVITGLAIQATGSSRPASGSEHQFSHLWEMRGLEYDGEPVSHGAKVALGSLLSTSIYERLLSMPIERLGVDSAVAAWPTWSEREATLRRTVENPAVLAKALEECRAKHLDTGALRARLATLRDAWPELRQRLREQLLPFEELRALLERGHCPTTPEQIGLTREQFRASFFAAGDIRRRYTVFDVALETGQLDAIVGDLFAPGGHWSGQRPVS